MKKLIYFTIIGCILALFWISFSTTASYSTKQDQQRVQEAIQRLTLKCYSIEGRYPKDLDYLKEHYGLLLNESEYRVIYHFEGANIAPVIDVYKKEKSYEETS